MLFAFRGGAVLEYGSRTGTNNMFFMNTYFEQIVKNIFIRKKNILYKKTKKQLQFLMRLQWSPRMSEGVTFRSRGVEEELQNGD